MYGEILLHSDIALTLLVLFCILIVLMVGMASCAKLKRLRKGRAIEYGIKDFIGQVRG
jgi:hypothetical protein